MSAPTRPPSSIVLDGKPARRARCECGVPHTLLCDGLRHGVHCDAPLCRGCAKETAPGRHLCRRCDAA